MKILLVGSTGMLGRDCQKVLMENHDVISPGRDQLDIISWDGVIETLQNVNPDVVLNCAGFTDVDACETESFLVRKVNVEGPRNLAQGAARFRCKLIHISSDYVFDGKKNVPQPYFEDDALNPLSAYGKSKMESETAVRENSPNHIIIRSSWLYGYHGKNFVSSVIGQAVKNKDKPLIVANDQFGSPTWTHRLALQIMEIISSDGRGTYHATAESYCTRFEYAARTLKKLNLKVAIKPCNTEDYPAKAARPLNCLLENRLLKKQGINVMQNWKKDLDRFLDAHGEDLIKEARARKN